jgi:hypothetical protein
VGDAVLAADLVEQHRAVAAAGPAETISELLAIVGLLITVIAVAPILGPWELEPGWIRALADQIEHSMTAGHGMYLSRETGRTDW